MGMLLKVSMALMLILMAASCATTNYQIPDKYSLDGQLKSVDELPDTQVGRIQPAFTEFIESFEDAQEVMARRDTVTYSEDKTQLIKVDPQSFILRSAPNNYYLFILNMPAPDLMHVNTISIRPQLNVIKAGRDYIDLGGLKYLIERIYKIENAQQMHTIKNQLANNKGIE